MYVSHFEVNLRLSSLKKKSQWFGTTAVADDRSGLDK